MDDKSIEWIFVKEKLNMFKILSWLLITYSAEKKASATLTKWSNLLSLKKEKLYCALLDRFIHTILKLDNNVSQRQIHIKRNSVM